MTILRRIGVVAGAAAMLGVGACNPSLDITDPNAPDVLRPNASPQDVENLAISSVHSWYIGATDYEPWLFMQVTSDVSTCNYGNFGMRFNNLEPRIAYGNNSAGGDRGVTESPWNSSYSSLGAANDAIRGFNAGLKFAGGQAESDKFKRLAQFTQAAALTQLALIFDKAFIIDETTDPQVPPPLSPYTAVSANAVAKWAALATAEAGKNDTFDPTTFPMTIGPLTSSVIARIANTMAALTLAYTPRNAAEAATVDWAKVAAYAANGIGTGNAGAAFDVSVIGDFSVWYSGLTELGAGLSWTRTDMRVINRMDPNSPAKFNGTIPPQGTSADARFTSDYAYAGKVIGDPSRGVYMQSPYYHTRYFSYSSDGDDELGPTPWMLAAESDLVRAEALIRTNGDLTLASALINKTRVGRGNLTPAAAADGSAKLLGYIDYERDIELVNTNGYTLFQRRHIDGLQTGTVHHLPIPAKELETLGLPIYTFGGAGKEQYVAPNSIVVSANASLYGTSTKSLETPSGQLLTLHYPGTRQPPRSARQ